MKKSTICSAAIEALVVAGKPLSAKMIYEVIKQHNLYEFKAQNPLSILKAELRKHSEGINSPMRSRITHFQVQSDGTFWIKDKQLN